VQVQPAGGAPPSPDVVESAAAVLRDGGLVILPTDTVYGIAADSRTDEAVRAIFAAKHRDPAQPLQLLFSTDLSMLSRYAVLTPAARELIEALGPGAWTLVLPAREGWDSPALSGGRTVGVRIVPVDLVVAIVDALGAPIAASSANVSGGPSPVSCDEAVRQVGASCEMSIDAGPSAHGLDSTVIDLAGESPRILREGAIDRDTLARILGLAAIPVVRSVRP